MKLIEKVLWSALVIAALLALTYRAEAVRYYTPTDATNPAATYVAPAAPAPGIPTKVTLAGAASAGTTLASAGLCVRISCTVACSYRVTLASSTAVADDNQLPANTPERFCLDQAHDTLTFFSSAAGLAYVAVAEP